MLRNVASQKIDLFAFTIATGAAKTGDAANLTAYVSKDHGAVTVLGDTSATEMDATNAPGWYVFDLTQGETDFVDGLFTAKSATGGVSVVGRPVTTTYVTGDAFARLGAPAGASVSADIAAVKVDSAAVKVKTDFLPSATAGAAGGVFIAGSNAATSITTALTANIIGNVTGNLSGSVGSVTGAVGSVTGAVGSVTGLTAANLDVAVSTLATAASLATVQSDTDNIQTRLPAALVSGRMDSSVGAMDVGVTANVAATVWEDVPTNYVTPGTFGYEFVNFTPLLNAIPTNAELATALGTADDAVLAQVALVKAVTDKLEDTLEDAGTDGFIFSAVSLSQAPTGGTAPTVSQIADEVQTRTIAAVTVVNGLAANTITAAATAADFTTEIQAGLATAAALATVATYVDTEVAAIKAKTDNLPADPADASDIAAATTAIAGYIDTEVAAIKAKTDLIPAAPAAVADVPTAIENADALLNRDMSTGTDSGSTTVRTVRQALRVLRNRWYFTGSTQTITKEDDTTASWTQVVTATAGADPITSTDPAGP